MTVADEKDRYLTEFIERVRRARADTGKKQWEIALAMGLEQDEYKHFESTKVVKGRVKGRVIPHYLIPRFCFACNVDPMWLLSGYGKMKGSPGPELVAPDKTAAAPRPQKALKKRGRVAA